jgi:hypothetical protein
MIEDLENNNYGLLEIVNEKSYELRCALRPR